MGSFVRRRSTSFVCARRTNRNQRVILISPRFVRVFFCPIGKLSSPQHRTMASPNTSPKKSVFDESTDDISAVDTTQTSAYDNESRSREVSPKLVVRGKKYGRRSRPQSAAQFESSQSDSEEDYDCAKRSAHDATSKSYQKVRFINEVVFAFEVFLVLEIN